jgi:hypothetical protein
MLTMDKMLDRENDALMTYCTDLVRWNRDQGYTTARDRARYGRLEREAECQRIDRALSKGVDPYAKTMDLDMHLRAWACAIGS